MFSTKLWIRRGGTSTSQRLRVHIVDHLKPVRMAKLRDFQIFLDQHKLSLKGLEILSILKNVPEIIGEIECQFLNALVIFDLSKAVEAD